jgi:hypothetical protein
MAFGIDDALAAAAAGISLTDTVVKTAKAYRKKGVDLDIERLIDEVRITALQRIDEADLALTQLERTLVEKGVKPEMTLQQAIAATPWWRADEAHRLKRIRRSFNALADATYSASDDIAALVRCRNQTSEMGAAVVDSAKAKHELNSRLLNAPTVKAAIDMLRGELLKHKLALQ